VSLADLVLWMLIEKWTVAFGFAAMVLLYVFARPRPRPAWHEVGAEGWRLLVLLAAVPAFFLGAELGLWGVLLAYRAPLSFTGLASSLGAMLALLAPTPLVRPLVYFRRPGQRDLLLALGLAAAGAGLLVAAPRVRAAAWLALTERAPREVEARDEVVALLAHRYVSLPEARTVLERSLPDGAAIVAFVDQARDGRVPVLGDPLRRELADRLLVDLARRTAPAAVDLDAVDAVWWLLGPSDAQATLRAYVLATPDLRGEAADDGGGVDVQRVVAHAVTKAPEPIRESVLRAAYPDLAGRGLDGPTIDALAAATEAQGPTGRLALLALLRDASTASLRPVVARFADPEAPEWALLREECPSRSTGLERLAADPDPRVAAGAAALRSYQRQYCADWFRQ